MNITLSYERYEVVQDRKILFSSLEYIEAKKWLLDTYGEPLHIESYKHIRNGVEEYYVYIDKVITIEKNKGEEK